MKGKYVQNNISLGDRVRIGAYFCSCTRGLLMPYPAGHRLEVRKNIIESARKLFNRYGFDNVSISQIMEGAGLTHGGFYSYFESKSDLYADVLGCFFTDPEWKNCWEGVHVDLSSTNVGPQVVRAYLSRQHFDDIEHSCPMVALPSDVARSGEGPKRAFETVFKAMVSTLERSLIEKDQTRRDRARAIAALCVGGMVVARSMVDHDLADELRNACTAIALNLGGWDKKRKSKKLVVQGKLQRITSKRSSRLRN
jgi:AcrR family transcriptional regulator